MTEMQYVNMMLAAVVLVAMPAAAGAQQKAAELAQAYMYAADEEKSAIAEQIGDYDGDPVELVRSLIARSREGREPGTHLDGRFEHPHLKDRYPEDVLNFLVPESYDPAVPTGLLILLHGGGSGSPRTAAAPWLMPNPEGKGHLHFEEELAAQPYISVAPSSLMLETSTRWSNQLSDAYLLAVIEEASYRYNINPDAVAILGQSMGGMGGYHLAQTIGDRFASVGVHAGSWAWGFWDGMHGVGMYIMHGLHDATPGVRQRFTDVAYARFAAACLAGYHVPHIYREHQGHHSLNDPDARATVLAYFDHVAEAEREPYPPLVVTASHKGSVRLEPEPHFFWVSIEEATDGRFELDRMQTFRGEDAWTRDFRHTVATAQGGTVRATNDGDNTITLETLNVARVTIWLNEQMVDFDRPVKVVANEQVAFEGTVAPSLLTVLESYDRKRDEGMLFSAKLTLDLAGDDD